MSWLDRVVARQVFGGVVIAGAFAAGWLVARDGVVTVNDLLLVGILIGVGCLIFDTKAGVEFLKAIPWPWRSHGGAPE